MLIYTTATVAALSTMALLRCGLVKRFVQFLERAQRPRFDKADEEILPWPKVAIVLCLRGGDPFLSDCLQGLLQQDYPDYEVHIIVDSLQDPAWQVVQDTLQDIAVVKASHVRVEPLVVKYSSCSLKCHSVIQAVEQLGKDIDAVSTLDSDVVPNPRWLRDLAEPLRNDQIGAATGYRWYVPEEHQWGAWVRSVWNSLTIAQMATAEPNFPWGGCCIFRTETMREANLIDHWKVSMSEDTTMDAAFKELGVRVEAVPVLMMLNRENCRLLDFYAWVKRQSLMPKLYNTCWPDMLMGAIINLLLMLLPLGGVLLAYYTERWISLWLLASSFVIYWLALLGLLLWMERAVRQAVRSRGEKFPHWSVWSVVRRGLSIFPTQIVSAMAILSLTFNEPNRIEWRGIVYHFSGPFNIRFEYFPYQPVGLSDVGKRSVM